MMSISGLFYIIGGQYLISKVWRLVPISGYGRAGGVALPDPAGADRRHFRHRRVDALVPHHLSRGESARITCARRAPRACPKRWSCSAMSCATR
jgi:hypothetical protein